MMREYHVRFCEGLGVKFPGPTRQLQTPATHPCHVRSWVISRHGADDYTPLDDFGDDIHIDNSSFHASVDLRAALSNDGDRMIVYTIK